MHLSNHRALALFFTVFLFASCGQDAPDTPTQTGSTLERAGASISEGEFQLALTLLEAEGASGPRATVLVVRALAGLGEVPKAVRIAKVGLAEHPDNHELSMLLADVYAELGQYELAVSALRAAREQGASDHDTALTLGVLLGRQFDLDAARLEFERAGAAGIERSEVEYNLAVLFHEQGNVGEAEERLRTVIEIAPQHPFAERELARVLLHEKTEVGPEVEEADLLLNVVLDRNDEDWRAYELIADVSMLRDDYEAAVLYYTEALRYGKNPLHVEDKFRVAARARNAWLVDQGVLPPPQRRAGPPMPSSFQENRGAPNTPPAGAGLSGSTPKSDGQDAK